MEAPRLVFTRLENAPSQEVRAQLHGDRRVGVRCRFLEWSPTRALIHTEYDPGLVLGEHGHRSDHLIYVLKGSVEISGVECTPGTTVLLEHGATFGPLVAGPEGTELLEFYNGDGRNVPADPEGYERLLRERGIVPLPHPSYDPEAAGA